MKYVNQIPISLEGPETIVVHPYAHIQNIDMIRRNATDTITDNNNGSSFKSLVRFKITGIVFLFNLDLTET